MAENARQSRGESTDRYEDAAEAKGSTIDASNGMSKSKTKATKSTKRRKAATPTGSDDAFDDDDDHEESEYNLPKQTKKRLGGSVAGRGREQRQKKTEALS